MYEVLPNSRGVRFLDLPPPDSTEVLRVLADTVQRLVSALARSGYGSDPETDGEDDLSRDNPVMAALYAAAVQGRIAMGADAGQRIARLGNAALAVDCVDAGSSRCATLGGFSLHAGVAIGASDRAGLERVCRYMGRPPLASERLERLSDGRIVYRMRHRWRDGTSALVFEPREFLARLAAPGSAAAGAPGPLPRSARAMRCVATVRGSAGRRRRRRRRAVGLFARQAARQPCVAHRME